MRKFLALVLSSVAMLFAMAIPAEAYRPAPNQPQHDICRNVPGWQGMPSILYGEYRRVGPKWARVCVPGPRHPSRPAFHAPGIENIPSAYRR